MIIVTGGAGFIGSALVWRLNQLGKNDIIIVDDLGQDEKWKNLVALDYLDYYDKKTLLEKVEKDTISFKIDAILHMGANSSTTEKDASHLMANNYEYTKKLAQYSVKIVSGLFMLLPLLLMETVRRDLWMWMPLVQA